MREVVVDDLSGLQSRLVSEIEGRAREAIAERERFVIALPGGSVAKMFFPGLAQSAVDWSRTDFFWIDERAVPPGDPESNYALASTLWLTPARVPPARIHRLRGEDADLGKAAQIAAAELIAVAGNPPHLDLVLIGVGEDGHIASIFPGSGERRPGPAWPAEASGEGGQTRQLVLPVYSSPKPPPRRLTLTMPVLSGAGRVIVVAMGRSKSAAIEEGLSHDGRTPLAELLRLSQSTLVLLDRDACNTLRQGATLSPKGDVDVPHA